MSRGEVSFWISSSIEFWGEEQGFLTIPLSDGDFLFLGFDEER